jgi:hypothetical protein
LGDGPELLVLTLSSSEFVGSVHVMSKPWSNMNPLVTGSSGESIINSSLKSSVRLEGRHLSRPLASVIPKDSSLSQRPGACGPLACPIDRVPLQSSRSSESLVVALP